MEKTKNPLVVIFRFIVMLIISYNITSAETVAHYNFQVDLTRVEDDRVQVILECSDFATENLVYRFPLVIPGTYRIIDYSKFIKDFKANDKNGNTIAVKRVKNSFFISNANELAFITYWIDDTWDKKRNRKLVHPAAGTNIEEGRHFFISPGGFYGYFDGKEKYPVEVIITKPETLLVTTGLMPEYLSPDKMRFNVNDYHQLIDSPMMFALPDTFNFFVGNTKTMIGVGHETESGKLAERLYDNMSPSMNAIATFLDTLPIDNYTYIIYFTDAEEIGKIESEPRFKLFKLMGYMLKHGLPRVGALEHNNSSFFYILDPGELFIEQIFELMRYGTIHEFLHIITPLNLHSF